MGFLKFTNTETGKVYDSREPTGEFLHTSKPTGEFGYNMSDVIDRELLCRYKLGKDFWINDPKLAEVLQCKAEDISKTLDLLLKS